MSQTYHVLPAPRPVPAVRLARPAGVLAVREPTGRYGGERDQAAVIDLRGFTGGALRMR
jgi:hypothetical protein